MPKTILDSVYYGLYDDEQDSDEIQFYWDTLLSEIELFADPKYKDTVSDHFYGIISGLCDGERSQGFKRGLSCAYRLATECFAASAPTRSQIEAEYREHYRKQFDCAERLRADAKGCRNGD